MPIYEYQCTACGHTFDTLRKISEPPLTRCPECGAEALKKLISPSAFRLKGGGWYETDFKTGTKEERRRWRQARQGRFREAGRKDSGDTSKPKK